MIQLAGARNLQCEHHSIQDDRNITVSAGTRTRSANPTNGLGRIARQRTLGPSRIHVDTQYHYGTTNDHSQMEVPDLPEAD